MIPAGIVREGCCSRGKRSTIRCWSSQRLLAGQRQDLHKLTRKMRHDPLIYRVSGVSSTTLVSNATRSRPRANYGLRDNSGDRYQRRSSSSRYVSPQAHLPFFLAGGLEDLRRRIVVYPILGHTTKHLVRSCTHEPGDHLALASMLFLRTLLSLVERTEACSQESWELWLQNALTPPMIAPVCITPPSLYENLQFEF